MGTFARHSRVAFASALSSRRNSAPKVVVALTDALFIISPELRAIYGLIVGVGNGSSGVDGDLDGVGEGAGVGVAMADAFTGSLFLVIVMAKILINSTKATITVVVIFRFIITPFTEHISEMPNLL